MPAIVPVRIWGNDRDGNPFCEHVCTVNISRQGTRVAGLRAALTVGETVGVQYRNRQARHRISWIGRHCTPTGTQVGLLCLEPDKQLWHVVLPEDEPDTYTVPESHSRKYETREKGVRRTTRYPVSGKAYVSTTFGDTGVWARLEDISLAGCYLKLAEPFGVGRRLALALHAGTVEIKAYGVVRVCYPRSAMGIEFVHLNDADERTLADFVSYLEEIETSLSILAPATTARAAKR